MDHVGIIPNVITCIYLLFAWIYPRVYVYWHEVLRMCFFGSKPMINNSPLMINLLFGLLWLLFIMSIYWGILIILMISSFVFKGKVQDTQFKVKTKVN